MTAIPENFLTRYNTTGNSCECPDKRWAPINYPDNPNYLCKHIKVRCNPECFRDWMQQSIPPRQPPPPGWSHFYVYRNAQDFLYSRQDIIEYLSKINFCDYSPFYRVKSSDLQQYHRYRINFYNTTKDSCECPFLKYYPQRTCKHIIYFRTYHKCERSSILHSTNSLLVNDIEEFNRQKALFDKEREEYAELLDLCKICYTGKNIHVCSSCKTNGICIDCYKELEMKKRNFSSKCPYCRTPLPPIVDFLVDKFKQFNK